VLTTAVETLTDLGYDVLLAHDGREALQIVKGRQKIGLLFSDIVMPGGINGVQLAIETRRLRPNIRVLLTSGYSAAALTDKHSLPKEFSVLGKPYRRAQLAARLRVIIGGQAGSNTDAAKQPQNERAGKPLITNDLVLSQRKRRRFTIKVIDSVEQD